MYFNSQYSACNLNEVNLHEPLYNTILPSTLKQPQNIDFNNDVLTLFSLGTLTSAKGQDRTIEFIADFLNVYSKKVRYILVGNGPLKNQLISRLEDIQKIHSQFSYLYFESLPHEEVMYIHRMSDIYIMLHRISIFDFATLEAMSQESAIILSKVGGNVEFNLTNNIIFAEDVIKNMETFCKLDFESIKCNNKQVFDMYFSEDAFRKQYKDFVEEIVKKA